MSTTPSRRDFLQQGAGTYLVLAATGAGGAAADAKRVPVIDTHLHCFAGKDNERFPYHPRAPYRPEEAATPQQLLHCMDGAGVKHAVVVHPEPYQDDHRYLEYCLEVGKGRLKGTALVFADRPGSAAQLPALVKKLSIVTVRIHAYARERLPPFGKPELRDLWKQAGKLGLAVQLHLEPRYAPRFEALIQEFSDITVIIDHLGRPMQGSTEEHAVIVRWSRFPNTIMKLSALPTATDDPHRDIGPIIKRLVAAYGVERLVYGGGFQAGATPESYRAYRERIRAHLASFSETDQAKVLGGNAARLFRITG